MSKLQGFVPSVLLACVIGGTISWIQRPGDFAGYLTVGELVLAGQHIYRDSPPGSNTWPPFFSVLCVPLALAARPTPYLARGGWLALNYLLVWVVLKMLARVVHGAQLRLRSDGMGLSFGSPEILVPVLLCSRFILGNFDHLQVNIVLFACALAGLYWHARGHDLRGGVALGLAAALKVMPVLFVPYFFYRRRYRVAVAASVATAAFSLSPVLVYGWPRFVDYIQAWRQALDVGWGVGKMNQSVYALFDRFIGHGITPFNATAVNDLTESGDPRAAIATGAVLVVITLLALWLFRGEYRADSRAALLEWSVVFIVSALFGPLAWKAYLVVLLCPCMLLVRLIRRDELCPTDRWVVIAALATYFVLAGLTAPGLLGKRLAGALEMLSVTTLGTLVLLGALLWLRLRLGRR